MSKEEQIRESLRRKGTRYTKVRFIETGEILEVYSISTSGKMLTVWFPGASISSRVFTSRFELI